MTFFTHILIVTTWSLKLALKKDRAQFGHYLSWSTVSSVFFFCPVFTFFISLPSARQLTSTLTLASFFSTIAESAIKLEYMFADWNPCVHLFFIQLCLIWRRPSRWLQREDSLILCKNKCFTLGQSCWCLFNIGLSYCNHYSIIPFVKTRGCCFN